MSLSIADVVLVSSVLWFARKTNISHLIVVCGVAIWMLSLSLVNGVFGLNSIISLILKIFLAFSFHSLLKNVKPSKADVKIASLYFYIFFILVSFGTEGNYFNNLELFNVNEGINYLLVLWLMFLIFLSLSTMQKYSTVFHFIVPFFIISSYSALYVSRQGLIVMAAIGFLSIFLNTRIKNFYKITLLFLVVAVLSSLIGYLTVYVDDVSLRRLTIFLDGDIQTRSDNRRLDLILFGIEGLLENPLGHGVASFKNHNPLGLVAHNFYISSAYELGVLSIIFIAVIILKVFRNVTNTSLNKPNYRLINILVFGFFIQLMFIGGLGKAGLFLVVPWVFFQSQYKQTPSRGELKYGA